jgi:hypothetical protein
MSVTITKLVTVVKPEILAEGTLKADGTEQTLAEYVGVGKVSGSVDLQEMEAGDIVILRQYMKLKKGGAYKKYGEETYTGAQTLPVIYFPQKTSDVALKVTLHQTAGVLKSFDYSFVREK